MLKSRLFIGASVAAALALGSGLAAAEPVEIRIQWSVAPAHMTPLIPHAPKGVCPSSKYLGPLSLFHNEGSGSSWIDVKRLGADGSSGGFGWSVF